MQEADKKKKAGSNLAVLAERNATQALGDRSSDRLRKTASSIGNEELKARVESGKASRDELLEFVVKRLRTIREAQTKEMELTDSRSQREWWKEVSDSHKEGTTKPEPKRWAEVAKIYEEAAYQMCRGALGRGRTLIERAVETEKKTMSQLTKLVDLDELQAEVEGPAVMETLGGSDACATAEVPAEIQDLAQKIQNVTKEVADPPVKKKTLT